MKVIFLLWSHLGKDTTRDNSAEWLATTDRGSIIGRWTFVFCYHDHNGARAHAASYSVSTWAFRTG
jgi:hypothetical protein